MLDWWWLSAHHQISHNHDLPIKITLCSAGRAYRSRCVAAGSGPRGSDTSPYGPAAGSRSSSPGSPWREERAPSAESSLVRSGTVRRSIITDILNRKIHQTDNFSAVSSISLAISFLPLLPSLIYFLCGFIVSLLPHPSSPCSSSSLTPQTAGLWSVFPCLWSSPESACSPGRQGRSPRL